MLIKIYSTFHIYIFLKFNEVIINKIRYKSNNYFSNCIAAFISHKKSGCGFSKLDLNSGCA
ncbi:hypothetical protein HOG27_04720 [bacterium]|nr:hypothetical protein [bacterium]